MTEIPVTQPEVYHKSTGSNLPINRLVIHTTESNCVAGSSHAVANYFATSASGGSAQYIEDPTTEQHGAHDNVICWHAPPNQGSIGFEITARAGSQDWTVKEAVMALNMAAKRVAQVAQDYNIPVAKLSVADLLSGKRGICGHVDVSQAWHQSNHTDPGVNFPWAKFIDLVKSYMPVNPAPTPVPAPKPTPAPAPLPHPMPVVPKFPGRLLTLGEHGSDVMTWQHQMANRGWKLTVDGQYGPQSVSICKAFQKEKHLVADGVVGPATWNAVWTSSL